MQEGQKDRQTNNRRDDHFITLTVGKPNKHSIHQKYDIQ